MSGARCAPRAAPVRAPSAADWQVACAESVQRFLVARLARWTRSNDEAALDAGGVAAAGRYRDRVVVSSIQGISSMATVASISLLASIGKRRGALISPDPRSG